MADEDKTAQRYFWGATIGTSIWGAIFLIYFAIRPQIFTRMFPHELGEFLAGFSAPVAFFWALIAVLFQRRQFLNETAKLAAESTESKEKAATAELEHWLERLGMEIQTLAATCGKCELHKKDEDSELLSDVIGNYQVCANLARSKDYTRLLFEVRNGLGEFVKKLQDDWVISAAANDFEDLVADINALKDLVTNTANAIASGAASGDAPPKHDIENFNDQIGAASKFVNSIQKEYNELGKS
jgi:hypothetical protein